MKDRIIETSDYQRAVLSIPGGLNMLLCGGRGGGKSWAIMFLLMRHAEQYGPLAYALLVRESYEAIKQLEEDLELLLEQVYKGSVRHNKTDHTFYFPNGAKVQFGQLADQKDYVKYQGKSYTMLVVDEYGAIPNTKWVTMLMSNLRGHKSVPIRTILAANPGGAQHGHIYHNFILRAPPWTKFEHMGQQWVVCPSTWRDNPNINQIAYLKQLKASCGNDEDLFKAWDTGNWNISRGAYFAGSLDENVHRIPIRSFPVQKMSKIWMPKIGMDWGSGAPSVCYIGLESPGVRHFPKGSLILADELATHDPDDLNQGLNWPPSKLADAVKELCRPWDCPPEGVSDDAYGLEDNLINKLEDYGIFVHRPDKERIAGWQIMRNMLNNAKERNGQPGLWISERCSYFWQTVPHLQRDIKRPEDILTTGPDHGADACRYLCMEVGKHAFHGSIIGHY